jgi:hypothetical protein
MIFCVRCNKELEGQERPCGACGCVNRRYEVELRETVHVDASLGFKHKRPGHKRPLAEGVDRTKMSRDPKLKGQVVRETYVADRENDLWSQKVTDTTTGAVLHEETLSLTEKNRQKKNEMSE